MAWLLNQPQPHLSQMLRTGAGAFPWNALIYAFIIGAYLSGDYYAESREHAIQAAQLEKALAEARLQALRAQLNPHFLFNALNAVSALVECEPRRARAMIEHIGSFLRLVLDRFDCQQSLLENELSMLEHYVAIQHVRFEGKLCVSIEAEPETLRAIVPTLILQPLVENAVGHGAARVPSSLVRISAARNNGHLELTVRDNGPGLPAAWDLEQNSRVGLSNTKRRLEYLYPGRYEFSVQNANDGGVIARVTLPFQEETRDANQN